jgi:hypothetical protein
MKQYYEAVITIVATEGPTDSEGPVVYTVVHRLEYEAAHPSAIISALEGDGNAIKIVHHEQLVAGKGTDKP